ncbi:hypothetical protein MASR2M16_18710 [Thauera terpenica]|jgi:hypothetical protein
MFHQFHRHDGCSDTQQACTPLEAAKLIEFECHALSEDISKDRPGSIADVAQTAAWADDIRPMPLSITLGPASAMVAETGL